MQLGTVCIIPGLLFFPSSQQSSFVNVCLSIAERSYVNAFTVNSFMYGGPSQLSEQNDKMDKFVVEMA